jgi:serine/threonine protein kinase/tetratricopeptide (TPR) repeat protein
VSDAPLDLGPFRLERIVATGGMAAVWKGVHRQSGEAVAIKVMRGDHAWNATWQSAFRAEVRAMARLRHPNIARVHDYGQMPDSAAQLHPDLVPGTPYLVMEYLAGGTLSERHPSGWTGVRVVLQSLLDALAVAHAHGVIHRDLKPANALLSADGQLVKLTDFGIAHATDRGDGSGQILEGGTPSYMAPEQFEGRWRDTGPWTDLYALGCLAWTLVTGHPPYGHRAWIRAALAHVKQPIPAFRPCMPVPADLEPWLHRLLQKDPAHRFRRAADTAWALTMLGNAPNPSGPAFEHDAEAPIVVLSGAVTLPWRPPSVNPTNAATEMGPKVERQQVPIEGRPMPIRTPPIPRDWRVGSVETERLAGAGLGLLGLQELPTVGRAAERDLLWNTMLQASADNAARLVILTGQAGSGKSRLAAWAGRRAHAVGACSWMRATHDVLQGPHHGSGPMMARSLGVVGLPRGEAIARTRRLLTEWGVYDSDEAVALCSLTLPPTQEELDGQAMVVRFDRPIERHILVLRQLARLARARTGILWLDDVQWSEDALQLTKMLLDQAKFPLLIVMTVRDEALMERPVETGLVRELLDRETAHHLPIPAMNAADQHTLIRRWLGLGAELARTVTERAAGNPLFAVQLVEDWVDRGLLTPSQGGFALHPGALAEIPDDLHDMWLSRVERVLRTGEHGWRRALDLGAALGVEVDLEEWTQICRSGDIDPSEVMLEALSRARLVRIEAESWVFVHGMLRESIERAARENRTWIPTNLTCAEWLRDRKQPGRLGSHLFAAERFDEAATPLLDQVKSRFQISDLRVAEAALEMAEESLGLARAPATDPRWGDLELRRSRLLLDRGQADESLAVAEKARAMAQRHGWGLQAAQAARRIGEVHRDRPDVPRASALFTEALTLYGRVGNAEGEASAHLELARCGMLSGDYERALRLIGVARAGFEGALGANNGLANCDRVQGEIEIRLGRNLDRAIRLFRKAGDAYRKVGMRWGEANCMNGMAEIARLQGDLEQAENGYRRAIQLTEAMGHSGGDIMRINLAMIHISRDQPDAAATILRRVLDSMVKQERWGLVGVIDTLLLCPLAEEGDWETWIGHADRAMWTLRESGMVDRDMALFAERAGRIATAKGRPDLADQAYGLAIWQWEALGELDRARALSRSMALPPPSQTER